MEHRWGQRQSTDVMVRFVNLPATIGMGRLLNISVTGAYMETSVPLRRLSLVYLAPAVPLSSRDRLSSHGRQSSHGRLGRIAASVVRRDETGVGLEWSDMASKNMQHFARLSNLTGKVDVQCPLLQQTLAVPPGDAPVVETRQFYILDFID